MRSARVVAVVAMTAEKLAERKRVWADWARDQGRIRQTDPVDELAERTAGLEHERDECKRMVEAARRRLSGEA